MLVDLILNILSNGFPKLANGLYERRKNCDASCFSDRLERQAYVITRVSVITATFMFSRASQKPAYKGLQENHSGNLRILGFFGGLTLQHPKTM